MAIFFRAILFPRLLIFDIGAKTKITTVNSLWKRHVYSTLSSPNKLSFSSKIFDYVLALPVLSSFFYVGQKNWTHTHMYTHAYTDTQTHASSFTHTPTITNTFTHRQSHITHIHIQIHTDKYTHTHTQICTQIHTLFIYSQTYKHNTFPHTQTTAQKIYADTPLKHTSTKLCTHKTGYIAITSKIR